MASDIDVQKVLGSLNESKVLNLDMSMQELVNSPAVGLVNSVAHLEPWDLICYTWVTLIRRGPLDDVFFPGDQFRGNAES